MGFIAVLNMMHCTAGSSIKLDLLFGKGDSSRLSAGSIAAVVKLIEVDYRDLVFGVFGSHQVTVVYRN